MGCWMKCVFIDLCLWLRGAGYKRKTQLWSTAVGQIGLVRWPAKTPKKIFSSYGHKKGCCKVCHLLSLSAECINGNTQHLPKTLRFMLSGLPSGQNDPWLGARLHKGKPCSYLTTRGAHIIGLPSSRTLRGVSFIWALRPKASAAVNSSRKGSRKGSTLCPFSGCFTLP